MKSYVSELVGTALLLAIVTGSGIMGESLAGGNSAIALLGNSIATGAGLYVLITLLGPISGAHFNPVVSSMFYSLGNLKLKQMIGYWVAQFAGGVLGIWVTHLMFALPIVQTSTKPRNGLGIWVSELVSTMILLSVIRLGIKHAEDKIQMLVALAVTAGYWFTSSTFFSNPAVTFARGFTDTFVGISPFDILFFITAQVTGLLLFIALTKNKYLSK